MRKKSNKKQQSMEFLFGKENSRKTMYQTVYETHHVWGTERNVY